MNYLYDASRNRAKKKKTEQLYDPVCKRACLLDMAN